MDEFQPTSNGSSVAHEGGRIPPQATEVEEAVLGAMLLEHEAATIALEMLTKTSFYKQSHQIIFEAIQELFERENPLDLLTVETALKDKGVLDQIGGVQALNDLTRSVSSSASIGYHAQILTEKALKRDLILSCNDIIRDSYDQGSDALDVLDEAEQRIFNLTNVKSRNSYQRVGDVVKETLNYLEDLRGQSSGVTGVATRLDVDQYTAGWQKGDLIIIAARPSMGKTAFMLTAAKNSATHPNADARTPVAIFSLEMSQRSLVQRLLTMEARVDAQSARRGTMSEEEFQRMIDAASTLYEAPIFIDDTPAISLMELRSKARRLKSDHNIGMIIVDYMQLMTVNLQSKQANREQEIASISRGLKTLAKDLDIPVIALAQLSRAVEQRGTDKRPQLSDLRESGSIEQDADVVCFLYRPEYYGITTTDSGASTAGLAEIIIGKQRNGPTGSVAMRFIKDYARFENLSQGEFQSGFGAPGGGVAGGSAGAGAAGVAGAGQSNGAGAGQAPAPFSPGGSDEPDPDAPF